MRSPWPAVCACVYLSVCLCVCVCVRVCVCYLCLCECVDIETCGQKTCAPGRSRQPRSQRAMVACLASAFAACEGLLCGSSQVSTSQASSPMSAAAARRTYCPIRHVSGLGSLAHWSVACLFPNWVHSSVARAADCRSAGPQFKSGCALPLALSLAAQRNQCPPTTSAPAGLATL